MITCLALLSGDHPAKHVPQTPSRGVRIHAVSHGAWHTAAVESHVSVARKSKSAIPERMSAKLEAVKSTLLALVDIWMISRAGPRRTGYHHCSISKPSFVSRGP